HAAAARIFGSGRVLSHPYAIPEMTDVFRAAAEVDKVLKVLGVPYVFIGGLALQAWGEPRLTRDVDISLLTGFHNEEAIVDFLLSRLNGRIANAKEHALRHRVLLLISKGGVGIDIGLAGFPFEQEMIERSVPVQFLPGILLPAVTAEDLVVMKAFAGRDRDWDDIRGIVVRRDKSLQWDRIEASLGPLLEVKETPEDLQRLRSIRVECESGT
ncbi:MAG: nucleotidyl transferase AbiEii/AbiGii toxin family protein, partial [Fimbriimonadales bacterium]